MTTLTTPRHFGDRMDEAIQRSGSVICVGLDPRPDQLPPRLRVQDPKNRRELAKAYETFCLGIIDAIAGRAGVIKPQAAFFEELGPDGMAALGSVIRYGTRKGLLVILDGKRNDIGTTAEAYARAFIGPESAWGCDALTVSPYLGQDSIEPFVKRCDEVAGGLFVLVKTSNPGSGFLQDQVAGEKKIYLRVAELVTSLNATRLGASGYGPVGSVVGATYPEQLHELRAAMPTSPILIPGFGAQGGSASDVAGGFDTRGRGAIVNSSRHIIFAYDRPEFRGKFGDDHWQAAADAAVQEMNDQLNAVRSITEHA